MIHQDVKNTILALPLFLLIACFFTFFSGCGGGGSGSGSDPPVDPTPRSVTIAWDAPTMNEDGTPITDLAGYTVYYGALSGEYTDSIDVIPPDTTATIGDLSPGTWYVAISAFDTAGYESDLSVELVVQVN